MCLKKKFTKPSKLFNIIFLVVYEAMDIFTKYFVDIFLTLFPEQTIQRQKKNSLIEKEKKVIIVRNTQHMRIFNIYLQGRDGAELYLGVKKCIFLKSAQI